MIAATSALFLKGTIVLLAKTARDNHKQGNMNNWARSATCQTAFLEALRDEVSTDFELEENFRAFKKKFAI